MRYRQAWVVPLLCVSLAALADQDAELRQLHGALNALSQEQQVLYQQFQMVQELRRSNDRTLYSLQLQPPAYATEVANYSDLAELRKSAILRGEELARQADELYAKFGDIEIRKKPLQQRIYELTLPR